MLRVMVIGGSGFIGTNLVERYRSQGHHVVNVDSKPPRNTAHASLWRQISVLDQKSLTDIIETVSPHLVFHMAARTDLDGRRLEDYAANVDGVRNVIAALTKLSDLRRVVFASSMLVCRLGYQPHDDNDYNPTTAYGASKVEGERLVRSFGNRLPWVMVRPTSLWGPWFDIPYRRFFDAVRAGWYMHPKGLSVRRSYGFVLNSVAQLSCLANADSSQVCGRTFYLADYQPVELRAWAECIRRAFSAPAIKDVPIRVLRWAAKAGDVLRAVGLKNPPLTSFRLRNLTTEAVMDTAPLEAVCGETPYDTERGVALTVDWINMSGRDKF
jgi:nucleoside-diphosphate-sugar epimerase